MSTVIGEGIKVDSRTASVRTTQRIKPADVLDFLKKGYTRLARDDRGYGSIQENYNLSALAVKKLFKTPSLKFKKTIYPEFLLEEDTSTTFVGNVEDLNKETFKVLVEGGPAILESPLFL